MKRILQCALQTSTKYAEVFRDHEKGSEAIISPEFTMVECGME